MSRRDVPSITVRDRPQCRERGRAQKKIYQIAPIKRVDRNNELQSPKLNQQGQLTRLEEERGRTLYVHRTTTNAQSWKGEEWGGEGVYFILIIKSRGGEKGRRRRREMMNPADVIAAQNKFVSSHIFRNMFFLIYFFSLSFFFPLLCPVSIHTASSYSGNYDVPLVHPLAPPPPPPSPEGWVCVEGRERETDLIVGYWIRSQG